jgi:DHA1 family tetracycline resistance protein-like MFS transporter
MLALRLLSAGMTAASSIIGAAALQDLAGTDVKMLQDLNARDASVAGFATLLATPVGGYLARRSLTLPYLASAVTSAISLYMVTTRLEETNKHLKPLSIKRFTQIKNIFSFTQLIGKDADLTKLSLTLWLQDVTLRTGPIFPLVAKQRFGWGPEKMGNWVGIYGACMTMPMMISKKMVGLFGERGTCITTLAFHTLATICLSTNKESLQWVSLAFFLVGIVKTSSCKSVLAKHSAEVTDLGRGQLQGAISSMISLSMIVSPWALSRLYTFFTSKASPIHLPGVPFVYCTLATSMSMALMASVSNKPFEKKPKALIN